MRNLYNKYILPWFLNRGMGPVEFNDTRSQVVERASGIVLEIGFGSGYNLPFYKGIDKLYALDPSRELHEYAKDRIAVAQFPFEYLECSAEAIPLDNCSVDTVVSTWTLCSIPRLTIAMSEIERVLKPGGRFYFVEHGQSPQKTRFMFQKLFTPVTRLYAGNCHLDRKIDNFIRNAGLVIEELELSPEEGRPLMFSYQGVARKK